MKQDCNHDIVIKYGVAECQNCGIEESKILNQNKMEQTAVEWLKMQLEIRSGIKEITVDSKTFEELCKQAKEMEKQQIVDAANSENSVDINHGDQYYNETFKNK